MNFYKNVRDQKIFNYSSFVNYIARYIYFIKISNNIKNLINSWKTEYIDNSQINKRLINQLKKHNFELKQTDKNHQSKTI